MSHQPGVGGDPVGDVFSLGEFEQGLHAGRFEGVGCGNGAGALALTTVGQFFSIPFLRPFNGPVDGLIGMATAAGIGDAELAGD